MLRVCVARVPEQVREMLYASCALWLSDAYRCDGLRFDSANDLPHDVIQVRPGREGRRRAGEEGPRASEGPHGSSAAGQGVGSAV